jgi:transketolase
MGKIDELCINTIGFLSADAVEKAKSGHPGMPIGDAPMAYVLWTKFLRHNPKNPRWINRDRFVLSAGHGSMLLYSLLYLTGHNISLDDIKSFRQLGSKTPGHPEYCLDCGIETTTGPLGQGFATGVGMAMAEKYLSEYFNRPGYRIFDYNIYGILSDGDMMEGISSEAASLAGHFGLGKIVYLYSDNKITIEGSTDITFTEDVGKRFRAYGWHVRHVDGYNLKEIESAVRNAKNEKKMPSLIIARTHLAYGCPSKEGCAEAHGAPLGEEEITAMKKKFGWPGRKFYIPGEALRHMRGAVGKGKKEEGRWNAVLKGYGKKYPELLGIMKDAFEGRLPRGWDKGLPGFKPEDGSIATRSASGKFLNAAADKLPMLIGGSADLAPSNNTYLKKYPDFGVKKGGRNIHFGVREHAMAAALNGMALSGMLIPYGGTFLVFADYMRPSIRLSALMKTHAIYVLTHDSIGLGEDGPTHQPVEHLASLRAMPGLMVIRPADANETVEAWKVAIKGKGPAALILTRQGLPVIDRKKYAAADCIKRGAYVLSDSGGRPDVILISSGSEVHLCLKAAEILKEKGASARVVNMACAELFDSQPDEYRENVLPSGVDKRIAVEAGSGLGWHKYTGLGGIVLCIERFGASAPGKALFERFGFTAENIASKALGLLRKK